MVIFYGKLFVINGGFKKNYNYMIYNPLLKNKFSYALNITSKASHFKCVRINKTLEKESYFSIKTKCIRFCDIE